MAVENLMVSIIQETEDENIPAATPDLPSIIVGHAYYLRDYNTDKDSLNIGLYGSRLAHCDSTGTSDGQPIDNVVEMSQSEVPDHPQLAYQLDKSSLRGWMDDILIEIVAEGGDGSIPTSGGIEFQSSGQISDFADHGVEEGDRIVITDDSGSPTVSINRTIQEVNGDTLVLNRSLPTPSNTETGLQGNTVSGLTSSSLHYRIEKEASDYIFYDGDQKTEHIDVTSDPDDDAFDVIGGVDIDGNPVNAGTVYVEYKALRKDLASIQTVESFEIEDKVGEFDARNPLSVGLNVAFSNNPDATMKFYGLDAANLNGEEDMTEAVNELENALSTTEDIYFINPLIDEFQHVESLINHAMEYSGEFAQGAGDPDRKSKFRVVGGGVKDLDEFNDIISKSDGQTDSETSDVKVMEEAGVNLTDGFNGKSVQEGDNLVITDASTDVTSAYNGNSPYTVNKVTAKEDGVIIKDTFPVENAGGEASYYFDRKRDDIVEENVEVEISQGSAALTRVDGDSTDTGDGGYTGMLIELDPDSIDDPGNENNSVLANNTYLIKDDDTENSGGYETFASFSVDDPSVTATIKRPVFSKVSTTNEVYTVPPRTLVKDVDQSFISKDVQPGQYVEVPMPPAESGGSADEFDDTTHRMKVSAVVSEDILRLVDGSHIPITDDDYGGQQTNLSYRVIETIGKQGQADRLASFANNIGHKRALIPWPPEVKVSGAVNGRTGEQPWLPGYYLMSAIAGGSASLPSQQGFSNLNISGIDEIRLSNDYFLDDQIDQIAGNGLFLFAQDEGSQQSQPAPYVYHQVSTDTSSIVNAEFSLTRNRDFVSFFFKQIAEQRLGEINIVDGTLDLLSDSLNNAINGLESQSVQYLGPPLIDGELEKIEQIDGQSDLLEIVITGDQPFPLNRIRIRLVV